jgi:hypothetical protein
MHFKITDFRAFHETIPVRVAPLTIMVGENSAGKTSFLAALRYVYDIDTSPETASFNKPPFFLGAYDQVAHFRGGKGGRADAFRFKLDEMVNLSPDAEDDAQNPEVIPCSLALEFRNEFSQPVLTEIHFLAGDDWACITKKDDRSTIGTNYFTHTVREEETGYLMSDSMLGRSLLLLFHDMPYMISVGPKANQKEKAHKDFLRRISRKLPILSPGAKAPGVCVRTSS